MTLAFVIYRTECWVTIYSSRKDWGCNKFGGKYQELVLDMLSWKCLLDNWVEL